MQVSSERYAQGDGALIRFIAFCGARSGIHFHGHGRGCCCGSLGHGGSKDTRYARRSLATVASTGSCIGSMRAGMKEVCLYPWSAGGCGGALRSLEH